MLPKQMGTYAAKPVEWSIAESGANHTPTFICRFDLYQMQDRTGWIDCEFDITGYFYLVKTDGQPNQFTIDALKESLGWDGQSFASLADGNWTETPVRLVIDQEEYEGKRKTKVKFINPLHGGGAPALEKNPQVIQSLDAKYGPMLRALAGSAPATNPAAPAPNGKTGTAPSTTVPRTPPSPKMVAWNTFLAKWDQHVTDHPDDAPERDNRWKAALAEHFRGKTESDRTPQDWAAFAKSVQEDFDMAAGTFIPF
jgi:hypothetical protein